MKEEIKHYSVYDDDSRVYHDGPYYQTTDKYLGRAIEKCKHYCKISEVFAGLAVSFLIITLFGCIGISLNSLIYNICLAITGGLTVIFFVIGISINLIYGSFWDDLINIYENSAEFKKLKRKRDKEIENNKQLKLKAKAQKLVESYDILDNKEISKDERIELIKKYIKED